MYKTQIEADLKRIISELGYKGTDPLLYITENVLFGDYTTNIALQLAKQKGEQNKQLDVKSDKPASPRALAEEIVERLGHPNYLERIDIAGPGFINFFLKDESLLKGLEQKKDAEPKTSVEQERILVEFSQPNTHKAFHIGHLRGLSTGESISRILEYQGKEVFRVTYGGDIGPHVAKAVWGVLKLNEEYQKIKTASLREKAEFLGKAYALGGSSYEEDPQVKEQIDQINKKLYQKNPDLMTVWNETKAWSIGYFDSIYVKLGTLFDAEIWESEIQELGTEIVKSHANDIFKEDQGAVIFPGDQYGLHNRVFITSAGYPTYEAKEIGLALKEWELFPFDHAYHVVGDEQTEYFKVVTKAIELVEPNLKDKRNFIGYGMVNLSSGKMSSRTGTVITGESLIHDVTELVKNTYQTNLHDDQLEKIAIAAIRYSFLRVAKESSIAFDLNQAISLHGDSGPYLLYTYARINSILEKARDGKATEKKSSSTLEPEERDILRQLEYFEVISARAATDLSPNDIATYLLNLAKAFNAFYEKYPVLGSNQEELRLKISTRVAETIKLGCYLLGFEVLDKM